MRLIDADELIKSIDCSADMGGALGKVVECVKYYAKFMVASAPTIEGHKTGKWEEIRVMPEAYDITGEKTWASVMRCNKCGFEAFAIEGHFAQYHFCPNCGADMRGEGHE